MNNMENNNTGAIKNKVKEILSLSIGLILFIFGLVFGIAEMKSFLGMIGVIILGLAGSLMLLGFIGEAKGEHGTGIVAFFGFFIGIIGGVILLINWLLK